MFVLSFKYARNSLCECNVLSSKILINDENKGIYSKRGCGTARHWLKRWVALHPPLSVANLLYFCIAKLVENKKLINNTDERCTAIQHWFKRCVALYPQTPLLTIFVMHIAILWGVFRHLSYPLVGLLHGSELHWLKRRTPKCRKNTKLNAKSLLTCCGLRYIIYHSHRAIACVERPNDVRPFPSFWPRSLVPLKQSQ